MVYDFSFPCNIFLLVGYPVNMQSDRYILRYEKEAAQCFL